MEDESIPTGSGGGGVIRRLDPKVVNRIAAGEVIQRPANAIKEMLENSLDAGATSITVVLGEGGLKLIQISDNGTGIRRADLPIVCQRFTTSKLSTFEDLATIATFGFRGEALASISHVAHLSILTKTADAACGYAAKFRDGEILGSPVAKAANQGTQITVEDLFYNVTTRRKVLKSGADEFSRVADVVTKYSVHNAGIAFTLKRSGENSLSVRTQRGASARDNVATLYGNALAKELIEVGSKDNEGGKSVCEFKAIVSNVNYTAAKKFHFLLFINQRLVDSSPLKRALEMVYSAYLPKGAHPFVYLSLKLDPRNVDVNVHPTKHEVHFLHQDEIVEAVQREVDAALMASNRSRTYYSNQVKVVPVTAGDFKSMGVETDKTVLDKNLVRTDAKEQKLDKFITTTPRAQQGSHASNVEVVDLESDHSTKKRSIGSPEQREGDAPEPEEKAPRVAVAGNLDEALSFPLTQGATAGAGAGKGQEENRREIKLGSVENLRQRLQERTHEGLRALIADHSYVGCVDQRWSLIQHATKLYLVDNQKLSKELFYEALLRKFGNMDAIQLSEPPNLKAMAIKALDSPESGWTEADGEKETVAEYVVQSLREKSEMLDDYFSLEISGDGRLVSLPMVFDDHVPSFAALPVYVMRLATEVNWTDEEECFRTFCEETAKFYAVQPNIPNARYDPQQHEGTNDDNEGAESKWKSSIEHAVFGNAKRHLSHPPKSMAEDGTFVQVADLPDLYRVFERC